MADSIEVLSSLVKALEAGGYNASPSTLVNGSALMVEDLSPVMYNVTFDDRHIKLQKMLKVETVKSTLAQFDRQLSYGIFGGSATIEGNVGQEENDSYVRIVVPMCFYSSVRRVTIVANMVGTVDGQKAEERYAASAAKKLAADFEFDCFRGKADFSNAGVFDGNPAVIPGLPNILGVDAQVRESDNQRNAQDLMFAEYGSSDTVVIPGGGTLTQDNVEDAHVRSSMNLGDADVLLVDPKVLSAYNKISFGKERIILAGNPMDTTAADLRKQSVSGGVVNVEKSRFLSGKTRPALPRSNGPLAPPTVAVAQGAGSTPFIAGQVFIYTISSVNEVGESPAALTTSGTGWAAGGLVTVAASGDFISLTITAPGSGLVRFFNVYRTLAGGALGTQRFIGRVILPAGATTATFVDLGNKNPGFVTGFLIQGDTMMLKQLAPYSRIKLAVTDLSQPEAHFRFATLAVPEPRKNVLIDNLKGSY
jgi:hypothetical protein